MQCGPRKNNKNRHQGHGTPRPSDMHWKQVHLVMFTFMWVILTCTTYLNIVADHIFCGSGHNTSEIVQKPLYDKEFMELSWPLNTLDQPCICGSIHGGSSSQLIGLKGHAANVLMTTAHLQRSCRLHASMSQSCVSIINNNSLQDGICLKHTRQWDYLLGIRIEV